MEKIETPCVGICEVGEHGFCKGCFRDPDEIADWRSMEKEERDKIWEELPKRRKENENKDPLDYSIWYEGGPE